MTQRELAVRTGLSERTIRLLEHGRVEAPHQRTIDRLRSVLGAGAGEPSVLEVPATASDSAAQDRLDISLLGPCSVRRGDRPLDIGSAKVRGLLVLLGVHVGEVVERSEIVDVLWGDDPPRSCTALVHSYVSALSKKLGAAPRHAVGAPRSITRSNGGYRLAIDPEHLDVLRFDRLMVERADEGTDRRVDRLAAALACWRGQAGLGLDGLRAHPVVAALNQRRVQAAVDLADTALHAGRPADALVPLERIIRDEPWHEGLHARMMLVLASDGQQGRALELFAETRGRLRFELGLEPGRELLEAHHRVLQGSAQTRGRAGPALPPPPERGAEASGPVDGARHRDVPAQLPRAGTVFAGREEALARLDALSSAGRPAIVVHGDEGVGKSGLALHWAHRVRDDYPDGHLYLDLGDDGNGSPLSVHEALARCLRALGAPQHAVALSMAEAAAALRTALFGRSVLMVLDGAVDAAQVRPLLPGDDRCQVVVTSRSPLIDLVVERDARPVRLGALSPADATAVLESVLGAGAAGLDVLVSACRGRPRALRHAAALMVSRPGRSVDEVAAKVSSRWFRDHVATAPGD